MDGNTSQLTVETNIMRAMRMQLKTWYAYPPGKSIPIQIVTLVAFSWLMTTGQIVLYH